MACIGLLLFNGYNRAFRPYLYDKSNYYYKAYHYKVKKIKSQKKIVKDIEIEVLHFVKDDFPDNLSTYKDSHYTDKGIDPRRLFLHIMIIKMASSIFLLIKKATLTKITRYILSCPKEYMTGI